MIQYLSQSFVIHAFLYLVLSLVVIGAIPKSAPIEVTLNTIKPLKPTSISQKPDKNTTLAKLLIPRNGLPKISKANPSTYRNQVISLLKSAGYEMMEGHQQDFTKIYTITMLINVNEYGRVINMTLTKRSGNTLFDQLAINTIRDTVFPSGTPDFVLKDGIEWGFTNGH